MMHFDEIGGPAASMPEAAGHLGPACDPGYNTKSPSRPVCGRVLFVAYHFPPQKGGSGLLRSLKFCRYLPEFGWSPTVLSIHPRAYDQLDDSQLKEIPEMVQVTRAFGLDTHRHLAIGGRYLRASAIPDRWASWLLGAVPAGLLLIRKNDIDIIFSTFPIATAVLVGYILHRLTHKPWVVDFRDSMTEDDYPKDPRIHRAYRAIERRAIRYGSCFLFTAPAAIRMYRDRYPDLKADKCLLLPNGYDEADFQGIVSPTATNGKTRLLHSGLIYPWERDPRPFFRALAKLKVEGKVSSSTLSVELRACGNEAGFQREVTQLGIDDVVHFPRALPYQASLEDAATADALLLLQAGCCDHQIPAKAYEYLRLQKPILALTTGTGDTAGLLEEVGGSTIADLANEEALYAVLPEFLQRVRQGTHPVPSALKCVKFSRRHQAERLAQYMSDVKAGKL